MVYSFFKKKLNNISISRKLYFTVGIMAVLVTAELCTLWFAVSTLSSVRSFVAGEGLWSKAEKDAVLRLHMYAYTHREEDYQTFLHLLNVSAGDRKARLALQQAKPDIAAARHGFIEGGNHPDDIAGMTRLILRFHNISYLKRAFTLWANAEPIIDQLIITGETLHSKITTGAPQREIDDLMAKMTILNQQLSFMENGFSYTLGEGARWLEALVLKMLLTLSLTIGTTSIIITISVSRGIEKGVNAIVEGAALIEQGYLDKRVTVYSNDEIGTVAMAFNQMTDTLQYNLQVIRDKEEKLEKERDKAEASEKVKQLFLMNMSHELRTPMNAILGFAHLLEDSLNNREQQDHVKMLIRAGDELLVILNDILDFARIESGKVSLESVQFDLGDMVRSLTLDMQPKATAKGLHLNHFIDPKLPATVLGDTKRLHQVLYNLLANAIKFTVRGDVGVAVYLIREHPHHIEAEFSVKDTGIGIAPENMEKIFDSFEQAESGTERKFGGTGIGLTIVKQLVELQGGKIFVNSTLGRGSEFHFRISMLKVKAQVPVDDKQDDSFSLPVVAPNNDGGPCILVVDDNPMNRLLVIRILQKQNIATDWAENGQIALEKLTANNYDMILMDLQMPVMDGYEATRQIRALTSEKKNIPIIAMTAHGMDGERERCLSIGMNDFIPKPFYPDELYGKINLLLDKG